MNYLRNVKVCVWRLSQLVLCDQLERLVVCFPVFVVLLAAVTFIFGGHCAAWQWWGALMLAIGVAGRGEEWRRTVGVTAMFLAYLGIVWLICRTDWIGVCNDYQEYHMPAVRMLIEGWNPLREATLESVASGLAVDPSTFRPWHVLSMCKSAWYFNAVAHYFMREPYNVMFPIYYCVLPAVALQIWKALREVSPWVRLTIIVLMVVFCDGPFFVVDAIVAFAGIGLLMSFREIFTYGRWRWEMLMAFSFWLLTVKQLAGVSCVVFWLGFVLAMLWSRRRVFRGSFLIALIVGTLAILTDLSPYYTSWQNYKHPLYPCYSSNEERYPVVNFVGDFLLRNDDAVAMGHLGAAVNAYVSSALAKAYYAWKLDKPDFAPNAEVWAWDHGKGCSSPTDSRLKFFLCLSLCICLIFGDRWTRFLSLVVIIGMLAVPTQMLGYERYVSWWKILPMLAIFSVGQIKSIHNIFLPLVTVLGLGLIFCQVFHQAFRWETSFRNREYLAKRLPGVVYSYFKSSRLGVKNAVGIWGNVFRSARCNVELLKRQSCDFRDTEVKELNPQGMTEEELESYPTLVFDPLMRLPKGENVWNGSEYLSILQEPSRTKRILRYPWFVIKSWFCTLPRLIIMGFRSQVN